MRIVIGVERCADVILNVIRFFVSMYGAEPTCVFHSAIGHSLSLLVPMVKLVMPVASAAHGARRVSCGCMMVILSALRNSRGVPSQVPIRQIGAAPELNEPNVLFDPFRPNIAVAVMSARDAFPAVIVTLRVPTASSS